MNTLEENRARARQMAMHLFTSDKRILIQDTDLFGFFATKKSDQQVAVDVVDKTTGTRQIIHVGSTLSITLHEDVATEENVRLAR